MSVILQNDTHQKTEIQLFNREKILAIFDERNEIRERCKGVHCVDLGESFQTHVYLQNLASIQPRTSPVKCARSRNAETYESSPTRSRRGRGGRDDDLPAPRGRGRVLGWLRGARVERPPRGRGQRAA